MRLSMTVWSIHSMKSASPRLLGLCLLACSAVAHAAPDIAAVPEDTQREAKAHFKQGRTFADLGAYDDALREFRQAYELVPLPELLFDMAQAYRLGGKKREALDMYRSFLRAMPEGPVSDRATTLIAQLTADLDREASNQRQAARLAAAKAETAATKAAASRREHHALRLGGLTLGAVGVAVAGAGLAYGLAARSAAHDVSSNWNATTYANGKDDQRNMYILVGVGGALTVGGAALYYLGRRGDVAHAVAVAPTVAPSFGGVLVSGRF
jgi:tetratricopeptide (TPR) repeat protein